MKIQILKNETYYDVNNLPIKGTSRATGYDIVATSDPEINGELNSDGSYKRINFIEYKTNLKLAVLKDQLSWTGTGTDFTDYDILAFPRSSISKYNLQLANSIGLIDADYRGEVLLRFNYLWQPEDFQIRQYEIYDENQKVTYISGKPNLDKIYKKGDKICQLKVTKVENVEFHLVDELDKTIRGEGGFGSTDNKFVEQSKQTMKNIADLYEKISNNVVTPSKKYAESIKERERQLG